MKQLASKSTSEKVNASQGQKQPSKRTILQAYKQNTAPLPEKRNQANQNVFQLQTWSHGALDGKQTNVSWTTGTLGGSTVGTSMIANPLGPEHLQGGPPKTGAQKSLMNQLETTPENYNHYKYIRGHLLNDNVGGPGVDFNLFPITGNANKQHEQKIEHQVKDWVNNKKQWVKYEVNVQDVDYDLSHSKVSRNYVDATFHCRASVLDPNRNMQEIHTISSDIKSEYKVSHNNDVDSDDESFAQVGNQAANFNPSLSKSSKVFTYNEEVLQHLYFLMENRKSALLLKRALMQYEGIGKVTVNVLSELDEDDETHLSKQQKTALNKVFSLGDHELLAIMGDIYEDYYGY